MKKRKSSQLLTDTIHGKQLETRNRCSLSIAIPCSPLQKLNKDMLCAVFAGQLARSAAIFKVDEVIIFDDETVYDSGQISQNALFLEKYLRYMECPQYLRQSLFPLQQELRFAYLLKPLDTPHHLRSNETCQFREGVIKSSHDSSVSIDVGLPNYAIVNNCTMKEGTRVTVELDNWIRSDEKKRKKLGGCIVSSSVPRKNGLYWGFDVRVAKRLSSVFSECPFKDGYDLTIGTSERGDAAKEVDFSGEFRHILVVFGGPDGLEYALRNDPSLTISDPRYLFDRYINTCPNQGSRTIRTEEAIPITLTVLQTIVPGWKQ